MFLTNHTLTGAALALNVPNPAILAPAAFTSHLVLDSLPHFGIKGLSFKKMPGVAIGVLDCVTALTAYLLIVMHYPQQWFVITVGVFFACLPDLFYLADICFNYIIAPRFLKLHGAVQWGEFPGGIAVEAVWAAAMIWVIRGA